MAKGGKQFGVREAAVQKVRAAAPRFGRTLPAGEAPRKVYTAACKSIADTLARDGFEYARSKGTLKRETPVFEFQIFFQSSQHNVAGELVRLWIHAGVSSRVLKAWRVAHPCLLSTSDLVAAGQIGNLVEPSNFRQWNLASAAHREAEIADAVMAIHTLAYPYFALFGDIAMVREHLLAGTLPAVPLASALDFLMCFGSRDEAQALARRVLHKNEQVRDGYREALAQFQARGLPPYQLVAYGQVLAAATLLFALPDLETLAPVVSVPMLKREQSVAQKPIGKTEQKARRILSKALAAELRARAKVTGWKVSQGWLFREDDGWFVDACPTVHITEYKSWLELHAKPMSIDPIFWDIVEARDSNKLPMSFRLLGAFVVRTPAVARVEIGEGALDAGGLADLMLSVAQRELVRLRHDRSIERFLADVQAQQTQLPSRPYLPAIVCALILLGRREQARAMCLDAQAAQEGGRFLFGARTFTDLAIAWLDRMGTDTH